MAKVTIRRDNEEFEVSDITFEEIKELVRANGYGRHAAPVAAESAPAPPFSVRPITAKAPDFQGFLLALSDRGRLFVEILQHHPAGIEANSLAGKLGFKDSRQIGGLTGGGIARTAKKFGVRVQDIYRPQVTFPSGKRTVTLYPGKSTIELSEEEKPAV
jgi:hypothetical protein